MLVKLRRSDKAGKKWKVTFERGGRSKTIYFGRAGDEDYTMHKDKRRQAQYIARHRHNEDWSKSGVETAGWWSRWLLWSEPTLSAAKEVVRRKLPSGYEMAR